MFSFGLNFTLYQISFTLGLLASYCVRFGLSWWTLEASGSTTAFASLIAISTAIEILGRPILSPMADYFNRGRLIFISYFLSAALSVIACLAGSFGFYSIYFLYALLMSLSITTAVREPASAGMLPELVDAARLTDAYASRATVSSAASILTPLIAAAVLGVGGWKLDLYIGAASAMVATIVSMKMTTTEKKGSVSVSAYLQTWHVRIGEGVRATFLVKTEFQLALIAAIFNFALYPFFFFIFPIWITSDLYLEKYYIGIFEAAFAGGMAVSGWLAVNFLNKRLSSFFRLIMGALMLGIGMVLAGFTDTKATILFGLVFAGIGFTIFNIETGALRALATPPNYRSRLFAGVAFVSSCANPIGVFFAGELMKILRPSYIIVIYGMMIVVAAFLIPLISNLHLIMDMDTNARKNLYFNFYSNAFNSK